MCLSVCVSENRAHTEALSLQMFYFWTFEPYQTTSGPYDGLMYSRVASLEKNDSWIENRQF